MTDAIQTILVKTEDGKSGIFHATASSIIELLKTPGVVKFEGRVVGDQDGPAIKLEDGTDFWFRNGEFVKMISTADDQKIFVHCGSTWHLKGSLLHRIGGPAYIGADGAVGYYVDGMLHREEGPAIIEANGTKEWFLDGKRDRRDGPAVEFASGRKAWFVNGRRMRQREFQEWQEKQQMINQRPKIKLIPIEEDRLVLAPQSTPTDVAPKQPPAEIGWAGPLLSLLAAGVLGAALKKTAEQKSKQAAYDHAS